MKSTVYRNTRFTLLVVMLLSLGVACKQTDESPIAPLPTVIEKGDPEQAITHCDQAIAPDSQDAQAYYDRGVMCAKSGDLERAILDFDKAIELNPEYGAAYHDRGNAYGALGDLQAAIRDHDKAIELAPDNAQAYYSRGLDYANAGDPEQAIRDFTQTIELNPDHAAAYYDRGLSFYESGDLDQAIADYDQAIALDPQFTKAYLNRGLAYALQDQYDQALADLNKTIEVDASNAFAHYLRGVVYTQLGENEKAISDVERALELGLEPSYKQLAEDLLEALKDSSLSFDGTYRGTTSQGQEFELVIEDNGVRSILVGFDIPGCEPYNPMSLYYGQPNGSITENRLSLTDPGLIITGTFSSSTSASGEMVIKPTICEGSAHVTWNASK